MLLGRTETTPAKPKRGKHRGWQKISETCNSGKRSTKKGIRGTMSYTVWANNHTEGWWPSDDFATLAECFEHIITHSVSDYLITKPVTVEFKEKTPVLSGITTLTGGIGQYTSS